jgi:general secretion pathway protein D
LDQSTQIRPVLVLLAAILASAARADDDGPIHVRGRPAAPALPPAPRDPEVRRTSSQDGDSPPPVTGAPAIPILEAIPQIPQPANPPTAAPTPGQVSAPRVPAPPQPGGPQGAGDIERRLKVDSNGRISLHMDDLDIRRALELLSRQGRLSIMVAPAVTGRVTANLEGVTVEQALNAILKLTNLTARRDGELVFVYSPQEFKQLAYHNQEIETRIYRLNYMRAIDMMGMIQDLLSADGTMTATPSAREGISEAPSFSSGGGGGGGAVAPSSGGGGGGGVSGPGGTGGNSLSGSDVIIIRDYKANLKAIDEIVAQLDIPPVQVLVEAVIISVQLAQQTNLGVNYAVVDNMATALGTIGNGADLAANSGFTPAKLLTIPVAPVTAAAAAAAGRINGGTEPGGLSSNTNGIKFGFVSKNNSFFITALESLGEVRVLASPRLLVLNKQKAEIQLGQRLGYATVTQNFTSTVQQISFLNTGTLLRLRPFVSSDGNVRMEIHPERSSGSTPGGIPQTNTSEMTTNVMIPDGATLVIGGLMEDERDFDQEGIPGLNRLPILGAAFGQKTKVLGKRELVVLLTPHIYRPNLPPSPAPPGGIVPPPTGVVPPAVSSAPPPLVDSRRGQEPAGAVIRAGFDVVHPSPSPSASPRSAPAQEPATARASSGPLQRHVVRQGEDLWSIAKLHYGSGRYYQALWYANRDRVSSPEAVPVGTSLRIPTAETLDHLAGASPKPERLAGRPVAAVDSANRRAGFEAEAPATLRPSPQKTAMPPRSAPAAPQAEGDGDYPIHIVGRFESLRSIARDRLGDSKRAAEIQALNRDILHSSDRITPGQYLRLPKDAVLLRRTH